MCVLDMASSWLGTGYSDSTRHYSRGSAQQRSDKTGHTMVLHEMINRRRNVLEATDADHRESYQLLNPDLTKQLGQMGELETAFFLFRECLPLVPIHHVNRLCTQYPG
jgi:hypothetical protein